MSNFIVVLCITFIAKILKLLLGIDEIWVSTDDNEISRLAEESGSHVHRRAAYTATSSASSLLAVQEFLEYHHGCYFLIFIIFQILRGFGSLVNKIVIY